MHSAVNNGSRCSCRYTSEVYFTHGSIIIINVIPPAQSHKFLRHCIAYDQWYPELSWQVRAVSICRDVTTSIVVTTSIYHAASANVRDVQYVYSSFPSFCHRSVNCVTVSLHTSSQHRLDRSAGKEKSWGSVGNPILIDIANFFNNDIIMSLLLKKLSISIKFHVAKQLFGQFLNCQPNPSRASCELCSHHRRRRDKTVSSRRRRRCVLGMVWGCRLCLLAGSRGGTQVPSIICGKSFSKPFQSCFIIISKTTL